MSESVLDRETGPAEADDPDALPIYHPDAIQIVDSSLVGGNLLRHPLCRIKIGSLVHIGLEYCESQGSQRLSGKCRSPWTIDHELIRSETVCLNDEWVALSLNIGPGKVKTASHIVAVCGSPANLLDSCKFQFLEVRV